MNTSGLVSTNKICAYKSKASTGRDQDQRNRKQEKHNKAREKSNSMTDTTRDKHKSTLEGRRKSSGKAETGTAKQTNKRWKRECEKKANREDSKLTFLAFLTVTRTMPVTGFMPIFCMACCESRERKSIRNRVGTQSHLASLLLAAVLLAAFASLSGRAISVLRIRILQRLCSLQTQAGAAKIRYHPRKEKQSGQGKSEQKQTIEQGKEGNQVSQSRGKQQ